MHNENAAGRVCSSKMRSTAKLDEMRCIRGPMGGALTGRFFGFTFWHTECVHRIRRQNAQNTHTECAERTHRIRIQNKHNQKFTRAPFVRWLRPRTANYPPRKKVLAESKEEVLQDAFAFAIHQTSNSISSYGVPGEYMDSSQFHVFGEDRTEDGTAHFSPPSEFHQESCYCPLQKCCNSWRILRSLLGLQAATAGSRPVCRSVIVSIALAVSQVAAGRRY